MISPCNGWALRQSRPRPGVQPVVRDEVAVHEALPDHPGNDRGHLVDGIALPDVVPSRELADVAIKVLWRQLVVDALVRPLEHRPEGFDALGVRHPAHILPDRVVDGLVSRQAPGRPHARP